MQSMLLESDHFAIQVQQYLTQQDNIAHQAQQSLLEEDKSMQAKIIQQQESQHKLVGRIMFEVKFFYNL